jgi:hypothetical protein
MHSAAATAPAITALMALAHDTLSPLPFSQVNGYILPVDGMRIDPRCNALRVDRGAAHAQLGSLGGTLLADYWEVRHITRMCPFRPRSRHAGTCSRYQANIGKSGFFLPPNNSSAVASGTCVVHGLIHMRVLSVLMPSGLSQCSVPEGGGRRHQYGGVIVGNSDRMDGSGRHWWL